MAAFHGGVRGKKWKKQCFLSQASTGSAAWKLAAQGVENKGVPGLMKSIRRLRPVTEKEKITPLTQQNLMATWLVRTGLGRGNFGK